MINRRKSFVMRSRRESTRTMSSSNRNKSRDNEEQDSELQFAQLAYLEELNRLKIQRRDLVYQNSSIFPDTRQELTVRKLNSPRSQDIKLCSFQMLKEHKCAVGPISFFSSMEKKEKETCIQRYIPIKAFSQPRKEPVEFLEPYEKISIRDKSYLALDKWKSRMEERRKLENSLAKKLQRTPDSLLLHFNNDEFLQTRVNANIENVIFPYLRTGGGAPLVRSVWPELERTQKDLTVQRKAFQPIDVNATMKVGYSNEIKREMGHKSPSRQTVQSTFSVSDQAFMKESGYHAPLYKDLFVGPYRVERLDPECFSQSSNEIRSQSTSTSEGFITYSQSLESLATTNPSEHAMGPKLILNDCCFHRDDRHIQFGIIFQLGFPAIFIGQQRAIWLPFFNTGTTLIKLSWKKIDSTKFYSDDKFEKVFFFYPKTESILPQASNFFPITFSSKRPGSFHEIWEMKTRPMLYPTKIVFHFHGTALEPDLNFNNRLEIQENFYRFSAEKTAKSIVDELIEFVVQKDYPDPECILQFPTGEKCIFLEKNDKKLYNFDVIQNVKNYVYETIGEDWDLYLSPLKKCLYWSTDDMEMRNNRLEEFAEICEEIDILPVLPKSVVNDLFSNSSDKFFICLSRLHICIDESINKLIEISTKMSLEDVVNQFHSDEVETNITIVIEPAPKRGKKQKKSYEKLPQEVVTRKLSMVEIRESQILFKEKAYLCVNLIVTNMFNVLDILLK